MQWGKGKIALASILLISTSVVSSGHASLFKITNYQFDDNKTAHQIMLIDQGKYRLETLDFGEKTLENLKVGDLVNVKGQVNEVTKFEKINGYYVLTISHPMDRRQYPYG